MGSFFRDSVTCSLIVMLFIFITRPCLAAPRGGTDTEFIRTSCAATSYPTLCYTSLSAHANVIQKNPKLLAHTALAVALSTAKTMSSSMLRLSNTPGLKHREVGAMKDCVEEMADSVEQIQKSLREMDSFRGAGFRMMISDVQTWVSAALTYEDTCTEGFSSKVMNGRVKTMVRGNILKIVQLTSNALALINHYAAVHG
uniref:Pectinesterase inhibitor domain-containing protein n=1 Tax=Kalanchoe fedtschenkoi TaxID=63787 RepID=A0A7N1A418_KALFE